MKIQASTLPKTTRLRLAPALAAMIPLMACSSASAVTITLYAVQDTFFNSTSGSRDTTYDGQNLRVHRGTAAAGGVTGVTHAAAAFDLSELADLVGSAQFTIDAAHLEYYQVSVTTAGAHTHEVYANAWNNTPTNTLADGVGMMNENNLTYNSYQTSYGTNLGESPAAITMGSLSLPSGSANGVYHAGAAANATELEWLNTRASKDNEIDQFVQFLFWAIGNSGDTSSTQSRRIFGDHESGNPVRLVLEITPIPEPSGFVLAAGGLLGLGLRRSRRS